MPLDLQTIASRLDDHPDWSLVDGALQRAYPMEAFLDGLAFVGAVAHLAERLEHHPDVTLRWGEVTLRIWSHDAGGVTDRDFGLVAALDGL